MDDWDKTVKRERKRFSKRRREIRKKIKEEFIDLVEKRIEDFKAYLARWCGGSEEAGKEEAHQDGERV